MSISSTYYQCQWDETLLCRLKQGRSKREKNDTIKFVDFDLLRVGHTRSNNIQLMSVYGTLNDVMFHGRLEHEMCHE